MHLKFTSGSSCNVGTRLKDATDVVLGTGAEGANSTYDTKSGMLLTIFLLVIAGWIPTIGNVIAGYVGGRKSGSPYRGFAATLAASLIVIFILFLISLLISGINPAILSDPEGEIASLTEVSPFWGQFLAVIMDYLHNMCGSTNLMINVGSYLLTVAFGVIGGVLADQSRKEVRLIISNASKTGRRYRSLDSQRKGRPMGFESYRDYTNMAVNSSIIPTPSVPRQPAVRPAPVAEAVVTETVESVPVSAATPTSSEIQNPAPIETQNPFRDIVNLTASKPEAPAAPAPVLDEDVSDCI